MINWLAKKKVVPMSVAPGDTIYLRCHMRDGREESIYHPITNAGTYDTMAIGEIENELGFSEGLVAVIGMADA